MSTVASRLGHLAAGIPKRSIFSMFGTQIVLMTITLPASVVAARGLGAEALGLFLLAQRFAGLALNFSHLSVAHGISFRAVKLRTDQEVRPLVGLSQSLAIVIGPISALIAIMIAAAQGDRQVLLATAAISIFIPAVLIAQFMSAILRGRLRTSAYNAIRLAMPTFWLLSVVGLLWAPSAAVTIYILFFVICHWLAAIIAVAICFKYGWRSRPSFSGFREVVSYGARAHVGQAGRDINRYLDQVLLGFIVGLGELGRYGVAANAAAAVGNMNSAILPIVQPVIQKASSTDRLRIAIVLISGAGLLVGGVCLMLAMVIDRILEVVYGLDFANLGGVAAVLLLACWIDSLWSLCGAVIFGLDRPGITSRSTLVALLGGIVALVLLTPRYGIEGAAWASVASYLLGFIIDFVSMLILLRRDRQREGKV